MAYRCDRCGEAIDEQQHSSFGHLCPACVRASLGDEAGTVEGKQASGLLSPLEKVKAWFSADRDRISTIIALVVLITLGILWVAMPGLSSVWGVCATVFGLWCLCKFHQIKERPQLVKKEQ